MKRLLCLLLLIPLFPSRAYAEEPKEDELLYAQLYGIEESLPEEERAISGEIKLDGSYDARGALARLWERVRAGLASQLRKELHFAGILVAISLLVGLAGALCLPQVGAEPIEITACCAAALLLAGGMESVISQTVDALRLLSDFSKAALPAFFTSLALSGAAVSASAKYAALSFAMEVMISLSQSLILPLIRAFLAVTICASLFENPLLETVGRLSKWCAVTAMTVMTTAFGLYVSLTGVISGSADKTTVKATKTLIHTTLPVVGGILSDSAAALLAAAKLIRNSAGVFCLIAVCAICAGPFVVLSVKLLVFKAASAASDLTLGGRYAKLLGGIGSCFGMLLGLLGSYGIMLFLSVMSGIRAVTG